MSSSRQISKSILPVDSKSEETQLSWVPERFRLQASRSTPYLPDLGVACGHRGVVWVDWVESPKVLPPRTRRRLPNKAMFSPTAYLEIRPRLLFHDRAEPLHEVYKICLGQAEV